MRWRRSNGRARELLYNEEVEVELGFSKRGEQ